MTKTKKKSVTIKVKSKKKNHNRKSKPARKSKGPRNTIRGHGGYFGDLGRHVVGGVGDRVDSLVRKVTGFGDYKVKSNSLYESGGPPVVKNTKHSSIVRHREYIKDITGSTAFKVETFRINPGIQSTFPWLAAQASGYEQYRVRGLVFEFLSTSADALNSTNTALGTVICATEYNSNLPPFSSKMEMENHEYSSAVKPSSSVLHPVECARHLTPIDELYIRPADGQTTQILDPLLYDLGMFQIATVGMQAAAVIGELWVSYEIEFLKPALNTPGSTPSPTLHYYYDSTLPGSNNPGQNDMLYKMRNSNDPTIVLPDRFITLDPGYYIVLASVSTSSNITGAGDLTFLSTGINWSTWNYFFTNPTTGNPNSANLQYNPTLTGTFYYKTWGIKVTAATPFYMTFMGLAGTVTNFDLYVFNMGGNIKAASRRAVDYDPISVLDARIRELEASLKQVSLLECKEAPVGYQSDMDDHIHVEPTLSPHPLTNSTLDLAHAIRGLVSKTAPTRANV